MLSFANLFNDTVSGSLSLETSQCAVDGFVFLDGHTGSDGLTAKGQHVGGAKPEHPSGTDTDEQNQSYSPC